MFKFIALALLVVAATAAPKFQDTHAVLAQLESEPFGKTMISAISLNVHAKAPFEDIFVVIDQLIDALEADQAAADEKKAADDADCETTITQLNAAIAQTISNIAQLEQVIEENESILAQAQIDLAQANTDYAETVEAIEVGTAERAAAHEKWANEDYDQTIQITTLDEGTKLINHMLHGVAFSQIQTRYEKVLDKLKNTKSHASLFKPLVTQLTQLATKLNYDNVMAILELLNDIRTSIVQAQTAAREAEEQAQAEWEAALKVLEAQKKALADKRARLTALIASTQKLLTQSRASLATNQVNLENQNTALAEKTAQCNEWAAIYATETAERTRELEILNLLREHMYDRQTAVQEYVAGRNANAPAF